MEWRIPHSEEDMLNEIEVNGLANITRLVGLSYGKELDFEHGQRVIKSLVAKPLNSGEANILTGVQVNMVVTASIKWWQQAERYHWFQIAMSESIMHSIADPNKELTQANFAYPTPLSEAYIGMRKEVFKQFGSDIPEDIKLCMIYNVPVSYLEKAYVTTNYLQLMTMYRQRRNHKLPEWQKFCDEVEKLPMMKTLLGVQNVN
ncbi:MAG TPA: hypothetical protein DCW90_23880 [Lachnospiraceae bacterium]|nr:hypothetical protein [Lachnospiraceae bacterium]